MFSSATISVFEIWYLGYYLGPSMVSAGTSSKLSSIIILPYLVPLLSTYHLSLNSLKLSQSFPDPYQIYNIVTQPYCHLFNLTAILNLSDSDTAIFSIL